MGERRREILARHYTISTSAQVVRARPGKGARSGRIIATFYIGGYPAVALSVCGLKKTFLLHKLVAEAFLGPCPRGCRIRWRDGNKTNCRLENLYYYPKKGAKRHDAFAGKSLSKAVLSDYGRNRKHSKN